jgi:DNA-binding NtrC family response regulator
VDEKGALMLIESDPLCAALMRQALREAGYVTRVFANSDAGLEALSIPGNFFSAVIASVDDCRQGAMVFIKDLDEVSPNVPAIFSGYFEEMPDRPWFLSKPFTRSEVVARVTRMMETASSLAEPEDDDCDGAKLVGLC